MPATTQTQPIQIKRRRSRHTTITTTTLDSSSSTAAICTTKNHTHIVISTDDSRRRDQPPPPLQPDLKIQSPPSTMGSYATTAQDSFPSSLSKFNSALTAGLLNPMSPPPPRMSPTLFEMMANDADILPRASAVGVTEAQNLQNSKDSADPPPQDKQQRLMDLLASWSPASDLGASDVTLTLSSKDGVSVSVSVHRQILVANSRFFASRLSKQHRSYVEIADCDDLEVYIETLRLMYCKDLRKKLMKEDVPRVLGILKVSAAIEFDAGVVLCLAYLEAAPWAEDEEEKIASLLSELRLQGVETGEVLKRVSLDSTRGLETGNGSEQVLLKLLQVVLEGKDEKARREMKGLVTKMLRENSSQNDLRKESLYSACDGCLKLLSCHLLNAAQGDVKDVGQIARQADNLHWLLDILMDRQIGEEFLMIWASQSELSAAHSKVAPIHRYDVSGITARLFVGVGKKQVLASKEARCLLLKTWLVPFYEDFGWMRRATRGLDRHLIEEGLSGTISTLPMALQQEIFISWFNRFLNGGDDCPNIQRGFQLWWKRAFRRQNGEVERPRQMRVVDSMEKSWM